MWRHLKDVAETKAVRIPKWCNHEAKQSEMWRVAESSSASQLKVSRQCSPPFSWISTRSPRSHLCSHEWLNNGNWPHSNTLIRNSAAQHGRSGRSPQYCSSGSMAGSAYKEISCACAQAVKIAFHFKACGPQSSAGVVSSGPFSSIQRRPVKVPFK